MIDLYFSLIVFLASGAALLHSKNAVLTIVLTPAYVWTIASVAGVVQKLFDSSMVHWIALLLSILMFCVTLVLAKGYFKDIAKSLWVPFSLGVSALALTVVVRFLGASSIGFGDSYTILANGIMTALGRPPLLELVVALKRSIGTYSVHALFYPFGEYAIAWHPFTFLAFFIGIAALIFQVARQRAAAVATLFIVSIFFVSTESVTRQVFLINSHIGLGLIWAAIFLIFYKQSPHARSLLIVTLLASAALRPDYSLMSLVFVILFSVRTNRLSDRKSHFIFVGVTLASNLFFLLTSGGEGELSSYIAISLIAICISVLIFVLARGAASLTPKASQVVVYATWALIGLMILSALVSDSTPAIITNVLFFEGLWGLTGWFILAAIGVGFALTRRRESIPHFLEPLLVAVSMIVAIKIGDHIIQGSPLTLGRVGWGDSINRMLFAIWVPFSALLAHILDSLSPSKRHDEELT